MSEVTAEVLESLATKLEGLDLSAAERAVLDSILERAADGGAEVEGFAFSATTYTGLKSGADLGGMAFKLGAGLGVLGGGGGRLMEARGGEGDPFEPRG